MESGILGMGQFMGITYDHGDKDLLLGFEPSDDNRYDDWHDIVKAFLHQRRIAVSAFHDSLIRLGDYGSMGYKPDIMGTKALDELGQEFGIFAWRLSSDKDLNGRDIASGGLTYFDIKPETTENKGYVDAVEYVQEPFDVFRNDGFRDEYNYVKDTSFDEEEAARLHERKSALGFDPRETWNLDYSLCLNLIPRLWEYSDESRCINDGKDYPLVMDIITGLVAYSIPDYWSEFGIWSKGNDVRLSDEAMKDLYTVRNATFDENGRVEYGTIDMTDMPGRMTTKDENGYWYVTDFVFGDICKRYAQGSFELLSVILPGLWT